MLKLSVIGVGNWGINHIRIFHQLPDVQIVSVCDLHEENLAKVRQIGSNIPISKNADEIIADPNIDAIVVATSVDEHYGLAKQAVMAGKHLKQLMLQMIRILNHVFVRCNLYTLFLQCH